MHFPFPRFQAGAAAALVLLGLVLMIACIRLFIRVGQGTLAPWDPTRRLVVAGPYRYTRNPMISGVLFILVGEAILLGSPALTLWAALFFTGNHFYFQWSEEPGLAKRFGEDYQPYRTHVPRWLPRPFPWTPGPNPRE